MPAYLIGTHEMHLTHCTLRICYQNQHSYRCVLLSSVIGSLQVSLSAALSSAVVKKLDRT